MKETWAHFCVSQNEDVMKSMLGERIEYLEGLLSEKDAEITQLRGNNKGLIEQNAFLRQRPDLPVDRIPAYERMSAEIERLKEGFKRSKYGFIRENAEVKDEIAELKEKLQATPGESQEPEATEEELDPHHPLE